MGLCCLQLTFQAHSMTEARELYDQLAPLCPIMLALTASSPAQRGYLVDRDCRWDVISASVDDRTRQERGLEPSQAKVIPKSRYDSIDSFLSNCCNKWDGYNDIEVLYDPQIYEQLLKGGVDKLMAQHVAHLFIRDSVSLFTNKVKEDGNYDEDDFDHFENIQSTNWQTMRFKPPPPGDKIGWRVEFRPCELQISDFENAAVCCFVVLLTRAILSFNWNLLMPMSIDEIFNGIPGSDYQGLIALVRDYLRGQDDIEADTMCTLSNYWQLLSQRASGKLHTNAHWMRKFIREHPSYKHDSRVPEDANYDLMVAIDQIQRGVRKEPSLFVKAEKKSKSAEVTVS